MLSLRHNRDTNNNQQQENSKISNRNDQIQGIKGQQHKNVNMTWDCWKFSRHPFATEKF